MKEQQQQKDEEQQPPELQQNGEGADNHRNNKTEEGDNKADGNDENNNSQTAGDDNGRSDDRPQSLFVDSGGEHPLETFSHREPPAHHHTPSSRSDTTRSKQGVLVHAKRPSQAYRIFTRQIRRKLRAPILKDLLLRTAEKGRQLQEEELGDYIATNEAYKSLTSNTLKQYFAYKVLRYAEQIGDVIQCSTATNLGVAPHTLGETKVPGSMGSHGSDVIFVLPSFDLNGEGRQIEIYRTAAGLTEDEEASIREALGFRRNSLYHGPDEHGVIGKGGQGMVLVAQNLNTQKWVALKLTTGIKREKDVERLNHILREVNKLHVERGGLLKTEAATHPYRYKGEERGPICHVKVSPIMADFALEAAYIRLGKIDRLKFLESLADSVQQLHQAGIAHLDLKPANILLSRSNDQVSPSDNRDKFWPVIADFGLATTSEMIPRSAGTQRWAPSYQMAWSHYRYKSKPCDIFSLGLVLKGLRECARDEMSPEFRTFLGAMTSSKEEKRPSIDEVVEFLSLARKAAEEEEEKKKEQLSNAARPKEEKSPKSTFFGLFS